MPTVTLPSPSRRAHSWDFRMFRSPGISLIVCSGVVVDDRVGVGRSVANRGRGESNSRLRLTLADERELHHAHRHLAATDVDADATVPTGREIAGRHPRERNRLAEGGRDSTRSAERRAGTRWVSPERVS